MRRFEIATDPDVLRLARSEEWRCALAIVEYPKMTHWVRNLDFDPVYGFWLPVASSQRPLPEARSRKPEAGSRFYPDCVCQMIHGRAGGGRSTRVSNCATLPVCASKMPLLTLSVS